VTTESSRARHRHAEIMRRLEAVLEANPDRTLYAAELCAATGASDRTLRACCQEHLGMSPMRYLWLRRMHLARRGLRVANPGATTVTEIATNYGFWELGASRWRIGCCSGSRPRRRCAGQLKTPDRKKWARRGSCLNLHSRRRPAEPTVTPFG
jgi:AraC-like DNA-binding protein